MDLDFNCAVYVPSKANPSTPVKVEGSGVISVDITDISWAELQVACFAVARGENMSMTDLLNKLGHKLDDEDLVWSVYVTGHTRFKKGKECRVLLPHGDLNDAQRKIFEEFVDTAYSSSGTKASGIGFNLPDPKKASKRKMKVSMLLILNSFIRTVGAKDSQ